MSQSLPSFRNPPVIETALSVQFQPLKGMSNAFLGLFWNRVRETYPKVQDADPIEPQIERFGIDLPRVRFPQLRIAAAHPASRLRMASEDGHLMLQIQNGRLVFNWRKLDGSNDYPRWTRVEPHLLEAVQNLEAFVADEQLGAIELNQWEVTYVNHLFRGREWQSQEDWPHMLPGIIGATQRVSSGVFETTGMRMSFALPRELGRLHVDLTHGYAGPDDDSQELLVLQLTARGGVTNDQDLASGLRTGHAAIVRSFAELTGESVQRDIWERVT